MVSCRLCEHRVWVGCEEELEVGVVLARLNEVHRSTNAAATARRAATAHTAQ